MATIKEQPPVLPTTDAEVLMDDSWSKSEEFFQKNKNIFTYLLLALVAVGAGAAYYFYNQSEKNKEAQDAMFQAVYYFEADSLTKALNGDGKDQGFIDIAEEFGSTKAGNLAKFYAGAALLQQGKFEDALEYLKDFSANDALIQARAYSLAGDAYMELKDSDGAIEYYKKASGYLPNEYFTPRYLMKLGMAYEVKGDYARAVEAYDRIINDHFKAMEVSDAKKLKARAEEKAGK